MAPKQVSLFCDPMGGPLSTGCVDGARTSAFLSPQGHDGPTLHASSGGASKGKKIAPARECV